MNEIIPIEVKAMCLKENHNTETEKFAHISIDYTRIRNMARPYEPLENEPFTTTSYLDSVGIHLHWIMPDEFTQGTVYEDGTIQYPRLPNRWSVTRMYSINNEPYSDHFIVESNFLSTETSEENFNKNSLSFPYVKGKGKPYRYLGRSFPEGTKIEVKDEDETIEDLNALSSASPYFTAYYHFCRNVFGFYDDLKSNDVLHKDVKITYNICGCYDYKDKKDSDKIFHGMITDIVWSSAKESAFYTSTPQIAVGNTSVEAVSALYSFKNIRREMLTNAFLTDTLHKISERDGFKNVTQLLKDSEFGTYRIPTKFAKQKLKVSSAKDSIDAEDSTNIEELNQKMDKLTKADEKSYTEARKIYDYLLGYQYYTAKQNVDLAKKCKTRIEDCLKTINSLFLEIKALEEEIKKESEGLTEIPGERFWIPNEPVIAIENLQRGVSHGYDERFSNDGKLEKRNHTEIITSLTLEAEKVTLYGSSVVKSNHRYGLPKLFLKLEREAALLSTSFSQVLAKKVLGINNAPQRIQNLTEIIRLLQISPLVSAYTKNGANQIAQAAGFNGKFPSKIAIQHYSSKWNPLILEWEVEYYADLGVLQEKPSLENWEFGENDYVYKYEYPDAAYKIHFQGRTIITPHLAETMDDMVKKQMNGMETGVKYADILSQALGGFYDRLLMRTQRVSQPVSIPDGLELPKEYAERGSDKMVVYEDFFSPIRAGFVEIIKLRVIDNFGRFEDIPVKLSAVAQNMRSGSEILTENLIMLPPRILQGARINFKWTSKDHQSIIGWLVPNYAESKLVFYNFDGESLGYLQHDQTKISWIQAKGNIPEEIKSIISKFIGDEKDKFDVFMKSLGDALEQINTPTDDIVFSSISYVGPLIALTSVSIALELSTPAEQYKIPELISGGKSGFRKINLENAIFPARIGESSHNGDGVVGFFNENFITYHTSFISTEDVKKNKFFSDDICISLTPSYEPLKTININLLIVPTAEVHVTTGILPQLRTSLSPQEVSVALEQMMYSMFAAPVISPENNITLPYPDTEYIKWGWSTPSNKIKPLINADEQALVSNEQMYLLEGWLLRENGK